MLKQREETVTAVDAVGMWHILVGTQADGIDLDHPGDGDEVATWAAKLHRHCEHLAVSALCVHVVEVAPTRRHDVQVHLCAMRHHQPVPRGRLPFE